MDAERFLRPSGRVALVTAMVAVVGLWMFFAALAGSAAWWPEHAMRKYSVRHTLWVTTLLSMFYASPIAFVWLWIRHVRWHISPDGIAIYRRSRLKRSYTWSQLKELRIFPNYAVARSATYLIGDEMLFLEAADVSWLREFAKDRLGQRLFILSWRSPKP